MDAPNIPNWSQFDAEQRARAVLDWCLDHFIDTSSIQDYQLTAAIAEGNKIIADRDGIKFDPAPQDYVDVIRVLAAFLRSRI